MEKADILDILGKFSIEKKNYSLKVITQGYINDTYLVLNGDQPLYILQRVNTDVFKNIKGIMSNISNALEYLKDEAYMQILLIRTLSGHNYYEEHSQSCWRLMGYIENSAAYNTTTNLEVAKEAGRIIGKFHQLLKSASLSDFEEIIPRFHSLELRENQFNNALKMADAHATSKAGDAISYAKSVLPQLRKLDGKKVPRRICHNDTKLNNILFSKTNDKALCLIDLDTLMPGYFHYDFGDAVRTIVNTAPEDEKELHKITFDKNLFEAFVIGVRKNSDFLTKEEIEALAFGTVLMPFLHGIRALTDHLNGNKYYKVAYENQNLDRSLSLFDFTKKAFAEMDYMKQTVSSMLSG